jgi:hypothetical protein
MIAFKIAETGFVGRKKCAASIAAHLPGWSQAFTDCAS